LIVRHLWGGGPYSMRLAPKGNAVKSGLTSILLDGGCFILPRLALTRSLWNKTLVAMTLDILKRIKSHLKSEKPKKTSYCKRTCSNTVEPLLNPLDATMQGWERPHVKEALRAIFSTLRTLRWKEENLKSSNHKTADVLTGRKNEQHRESMDVKNRGLGILPRTRKKLTILGACRWSMTAS